MARMTLGEALRANASKRPPYAGGDWRLVEGGIEPVHPVAVDCAGSDPNTDPCYNKPVWVIEHYDGFAPTCLEHSGKVLNVLLPPPEKAAETSLYFHPYKGE